MSLSVHVTSSSHEIRGVVTLVTGTYRQLLVV